VLVLKLTFIKLTFVAHTLENSLDFFYNVSYCKLET